MQEGSGQQYFPCRHPGRLAIVSPSIDNHVEHRHTAGIENYSFTSKLLGQPCLATSLYLKKRKMIIVDIKHNHLHQNWNILSRSSKTCPSSDFLRGGGATIMGCDLSTTAGSEVLTTSNTYCPGGPSVRPVKLHLEEKPLCFVLRGWTVLPANSAPPLATTFSSPTV